MSSVVVKSHFTSADVRASTLDIRKRTEGLRVVNVYDLNERTYLIKFSVPASASVPLPNSSSAPSDGERVTKQFVLIESGVRCYATSIPRETPSAPAPFTSKLRLHLRATRLESVQQIGFDRVLDFKFSGANGVVHLIVQLFRGGNVILMDSNYVVIALLRSLSLGEEGKAAVRVGEVFPVAYATNLTTETELRTACFTSYETFQEVIEKRIETAKQAELAAIALVKATEASGGKTPKRMNKNKMGTLKQLLLSDVSPVHHLGPEIVEHAILTAGLPPTKRLPELLELLTEEKFQALLSAFEASTQVVSCLDQNSRGYILYSLMPSTSAEKASIEENKDEVKTEEQDQFVYEEFTPLLLKQHEGRMYKEFSTFSEAVDEFYRRIETQKAELAAAAREAANLQRINKTRDEQLAAIHGLRVQCLALKLSGDALQRYPDVVKETCSLINTALEARHSWVAIEAMVEHEKLLGNPFASMIETMDLMRGEVVLAFVTEDLEEIIESYQTDEEKEEATASEDGLDSITREVLGSEGVLLVPVKLNLSPHANTNELYTQHRKCLIRLEKISEVSERNLANSLASVAAQKENAQIAIANSVVKKTHWFEKFAWFVSSEGFLVLSGKDSTQNELLVRRYLRPCDVYLHAEVDGASSCIVRAKRRQQVLPKGDATDNTFPEEGAAEGTSTTLADKFYITPLALQEAGGFAVCRSRAWSARMLVSAYWVRREQVSKTAPSGEYLTTGSFMVTGRKKFLPPMPLEMGFGILFRLSDESVGAALARRKMREYSGEEVQYSAEALREAYSRYALQDSLENAPLIGTETSASVNDDADADAALVKEAAEEAVESVPAEDVNFDEEWPAEDSEEEKPYARPPPKSNSAAKEISNAPVNTKRKKKLSKTKARRYAEQDEDDREAAMLMLGHARKDGAKLNDLLRREDTERLEAELKSKQVEMGVDLLLGSFERGLDSLTPSVHESITTLVSEKLIKSSDLGEAELKALGALNEADGLRVVQLFREGKDLREVKNKSAFLLGILRRITRANLSGQSTSGPSGNATLTAAQLANEEDRELNAFLAEEGIVRTPEGLVIEDIDRFTSAPIADDVILYAIPVCGPYAAMQRFKFKVKLTPGSLKRSKAVKTAVEMFTKDATQREKQLIRAIPDADMCSAIIGDVKVSSAGASAASQQVKKKQQRGQKK